MRVVRATDHRVMPWKNGGGVTREVLVAPDPANSSQFFWRISIATVAESGPFSRFPGIDRTIAVLDGGGMRLRIEGSDVALFPDSEPFRFSGDLDVQSELIGGETMDLNVMTRRGRFDHFMRRVNCNGAATISTDAPLTVVIADCSIGLLCGSTREHLNRFDALAEIAQGKSVYLEAGEPCDVFVIGLTPLAR